MAARAAEAGIGQGTAVQAGRSRRRLAGAIVADGLLARWFTEMDSARRRRRRAGSDVAPGARRLSGRQAGGAPERSANGNNLGRPGLDRANERAIPGRQGRARRPRRHAGHAPGGAAPGGRGQRDRRRREAHALPEQDHHRHGRTARTGARRPQARRRACCQRPRMATVLGAPVFLRRLGQRARGPFLYLRRRPGQRFHRRPWRERKGADAGRHA